MCTMTIWEKVEKALRISLLERAQTSWSMSTCNQCTVGEVGVMYKHATRASTDVEMVEKHGGEGWRLW